MWRGGKLREHMPEIIYFLRKMTRAISHYFKMRGVIRAEVPEKSCSSLEYSLWIIKNAAHRNRLEKNFKKRRKSS